MGRDSTVNSHKMHAKKVTPEIYRQSMPRCLNPLPVGVSEWVKGLTRKTDNTVPKLPE